MGKITIKMLDIVANVWYDSGIRNEVKSMGYIMLSITSIMLCILSIVIIRNIKPITMNKILISMIISVIFIWLAIIFLILWFITIFI